MNRVIYWLRNISLRQIATVFMAAMTFLVIPAFSYNVSVQAQAETLIADTDSYKVDSATIKRIQEKAEDLGDSPERPIGDTGLKNIKKLGENVPETIELNARQGFFSGDPDNLDKKTVLDDVQDRVEGAVKGTKQAVKDATS
jgi:predicted PurR-regulated permease PerM